MKRFIGLVLAGVALAGCSDRVTMPTAARSASGASYDSFGDPPPPPIGGRDASAEFNSQSTDCAASALFHFAYTYFVNAPGNNSWLHIDSDDRSSQIDIHQTKKKLDAHGVIVGPNFTFTIQDAVAGSIVDPEQHVPRAVSVQLSGTLKTGNKSCSTTGTFTMLLSGEVVVGN